MLESSFFDIHIDASLMYGSGQSLDIIKSLCLSFPTIKVSVKYGLVPRLDEKGRWGVDVCSDTDASLVQTIYHYLEYIPIKNLYSFQFHAFSADLLDNWLHQLSEFSFIKSFGVSNMSLPEASLVRSRASIYNLN
ncbi:hypothetical protein N8478_01410, partial [bacterium]|nr:hypothetical protein [bacterium]